MRIRSCSQYMWVAVGTCLLIGGRVRDVRGQERVEVGGLAYFDYFYTLDAVDEEEEGAHGFTYRRLYLTTDFVLSDAFSGRARLEASASTSGSRGPVPFVKDLFLQWRWHPGHALTFGVTSPDAFSESEDVWDYRSLEATVMDLVDAVDSRDFGVKATGNVTPDGVFRYVLMYGNNEAARPEEDVYKRLYAQLEAHPTDNLVFTVGGDYAGYDGALDDGFRLSAFGGYTSDRLRAGVEGYLHRLDYAGVDGETSGLGVSVFGVVNLSSEWEVVGRVDRVRLAHPSDAVLQTVLLAGLAYQPHPQVRFIPNLYVTRYDEVDRSDVLGRATLEFEF